MKVVKKIKYTNKKQNAILVMSIIQEQIRLHCTGTSTPLNSREEKYSSGEQNHSDFEKKFLRRSLW